MNREQAKVVDYLREEDQVPREQLCRRRLQVTTCQQARLVARAGGLILNDAGVRVRNSVAAPNMNALAEPQSRARRHAAREHAQDEGQPQSTASSPGTIRLSKPVPDEMRAPRRKARVGGGRTQVAIVVVKRPGDAVTLKLLDMVS